MDGGVSLESYVTNIQTKDIMPSVMSCLCDESILYGHYFDYALVIIIGLFLAHYCNKISFFIIQKI